MESRRPFLHQAKQLDPKRANLQAAFSEPVYERLALREGQNLTTLLAFVRPIGAELRRYLTTIGALPSQRFAADCYREIWELPAQVAQSRNLSELDLCIASGLNILQGNYSHTAGYWFRPDSGKKHSTSRLLSLSQPSRSLGP